MASQALALKCAKCGREAKCSYDDAQAGPLTVKLDHVDEYTHEFIPSNKDGDRGHRALLRDPEVVRPIRYTPLF